MISLPLIVATALGGPVVTARDLDRFWETAQVTEAHWRFAEAHVHYLENNEPWEATWLAEARWCKRCWCLLDDCKRTFPKHPDIIAPKLRELKNLLGAEAFAAGLMPPAAPFWRFRMRE